MIRRHFYGPSVLSLNTHEANSQSQCAKKVEQHWENEGETWAFMVWWLDLTTYLGAHPQWGGGGGDDGAAGRGGARGRPFSSVGRRARPARVCIILTFQLASPHLVDFHRGGAEPNKSSQLAHTIKLLSIRESKKCLCAVVGLDLAALWSLLSVLLY